MFEPKWRKEYKEKVIRDERYREAKQKRAERKALERAQINYDEPGGSDGSVGLFVIGVIIIIFILNAIF